jgi:hypothetical protein
MTVRTRGSAVDSLDLLMRCPSQDMGSAWWWASLAQQLGELVEELASTDVVGLAAQITAFGATPWCGMHPASGTRAR